MKVAPDSRWTIFLVVTLLWSVLAPQAAAVTEQVQRQAADRLVQDLREVMQLQDVCVEVDEQCVAIGSQFPDVDDGLALIPIVAYALVNASLSAPWVAEIYVVMHANGMPVYQLRAARADVDRFVDGDTDARSFVQSWEISDFADEVSLSPTDLLLQDFELPQEWQASTPRLAEANDITPLLLPATVLDGRQVRGIAVQDVQTPEGWSKVAVVLLAGPAQALALLEDLQNTQGAVATGSIVELPGPVPVLVTVRDSALIIASGPSQDATLALQQLGTLSMPAQQPPLSELPPEALAGQQVGAGTQIGTGAEAKVEQKAAISLAESSVVKEAVLCEGVDENNQPKGVTNCFPPGTAKLGLYLRIVDAPANTELILKWYRGQRLLDRRMVLVAGDRQLINCIYAARTESLRAGGYTVEISENGDLVARMPFTVQ
ncbi:MAG: hypothetical protein KAW89_01075 [Armatimonadetes bacterium]|nr:hypothetical protein [Armatimonadota bacterium]